MFQIERFFNHLCSENNERFNVKKMASKISFQDVIENQEKLEAFHTYLEDDDISFLLDFYSLIHSLRTKNFDGDTKSRLIRQIFKTFFRKRDDKINFNSNGLDTLGFDNSIVDKVLEKNKKDRNLAPDTFNEAYDWVEKFLRSKCLPNFLKSPHFTDSLSELENHLSERFSETASTASTVRIEEKITNDSVEIPTGNFFSKAMFL